MTVQQHRRPKPPRGTKRPPKNNNGRLGRSNQERQQALSRPSSQTETTTFGGEAGMTDFLQPQTVSATEQAEEESGDLAASRADAAVTAAYLTYEEGVERHGEGNSWETTGSNRGPIVDEIQEANNSSGQEWCGMFIGDSYQKAGIREEIMRNLVFWSGYRLHLFFTAGQYIGGTFGSWWQTHQTVQIGSATGDARKAILDGFNPQPGDVALFRSDYSHVGMVTSYDPSTGTLEIIEGNRGNRVQASVYETGDNEIRFLGRFNSSDYEPGGQVDSTVANAETPTVQHTPGGGSIN